MFAGIRTAAVYVIATATLAAIAGGGGLGDIIVNQASYEHRGRARRRRSAVAALALRGRGAVRRCSSARSRRAALRRQTRVAREPSGRSAAARGRETDIDPHRRSEPMRRTHTSQARDCSGSDARAVAALRCSPHCGGRRRQRRAAPRDHAGRQRASPGTGKPAVTLGDKNFTEEYVLGELYKQALEAKGYKVNAEAEHRLARRSIDKALTSGQIDMYPEYTGMILSERRRHETKRPADADGGLRGGEGVRGGARLHAARQDAVLRHRRAGA